MIKTKPTFEEAKEATGLEPRIELFARKKRLGWDCWGNQIEGDIDLTKYS